MKKLLIPVCAFFIIMFFAIKFNKKDAAPQESARTETITEHYTVSFDPFNINNMNISGSSFEVRIFMTNKPHIRIDVDKKLSGCYEKEFLEGQKDYNNLIMETEGGTLRIEPSKQKTKYKLFVEYYLAIYIPHRAVNFSINAENLNLSVLDDFEGNFSLNFHDGKILFKNLKGKLNVNTSNATVNVENGMLESGSGVHIKSKGNIYLGAALSESGESGYMFETEDGNITVNYDYVRDFDVFANSLMVDEKYNSAKNNSNSDDNGKIKVYLNASKGIIKFE